ncbi:MAG: DUF2027 domain-containing protein [Paramuribaculum sp.]|nr:DUF2027 domain-containing protein [Paramuribaculum sp.]MDE6489419.1 DUF2027 domain-containing protein [Paramuribaculum sp.]
MVKLGDIVRFLNSVGGGRVTKIKDNLAYVEDEDGFETPVLLRECVVVGSAPARPATASAPAVAPIVAKAPDPQPPAAPTAEETLPIVETPEGEKINLTLAYEPLDIKKLSATTFDTYLVNDSNYFLYFAYMTRARENDRWTTRYAGIVEPNIQVFLGETLREDLPQMDRVAIQYIAFKRDREFSAKQPEFIEMPLDTTKFARLHCFAPNVYFDSPVIALDAVCNDIPRHETPIDSQRLSQAMKEKKSADFPRRRVVKKRTKAERKAGDTIVVDLHISELVDNTRGLSNADMLNLQIDEFSRIMDENLKKKGQKIVFIHGKGEGVLRNAILKELNHRYKGHDVQDASFREYGFGATQVTI